MGLFDFLTKKTAPAAPPKQDHPLTLADRNGRSAEAVIEELDGAGYFKYDETRDLPKLKKEIGQALAEKGSLPFVDTVGQDYRIADLRHYLLDNEDLYEEFGIISALDKMKPLFEKIGVLMDITEHVEEYDSKNQWVDQSIKINGKPYLIFQQFRGYGWGEAAQRFADLINDQLLLQQCDERLYLINGGNEGRAVFLTEELFDLLGKYITEPKEKPLRINEWCQLQEVIYHKVD